MAASDGQELPNDAEDPDTSESEVHRVYDEDDHQLYEFLTSLCENRAELTECPT